MYGGASALDVLTVSVRLLGVGQLVVCVIVFERMVVGMRFGADLAHRIPTTISVIAAAPNA